jgi:hypothetical protein
MVEKQKGRTCSMCSRASCSKGFCKKHYYWMKRHSDDPKDIEAYVNKPKQLSAKRWSSFTADEKTANVQEHRERRQEKILALSNYVEYKCALHGISQCSNDLNSLKQDHDHSCGCGKRTGCSECFRGFLCTVHNRLVLPVLEKLNVKFIPDPVKVYLEQRPLKGTGLHPLR